MRRDVLSTGLRHHRERRPVCAVNRRGFTLIEVLLSVAFFSVGALVIASAFLKTAELLTVAEDRFPATLICHNAMVEVEEQLREEMTSEKLIPSRAVEEYGRKYEVRTRAESEGKSKTLYELEATVDWPSKHKQSVRQNLTILL